SEPPAFLFAHSRLTARMGGLEGPMGMTAGAAVLLLAVAGIHSPAWAQPSSITTAPRGQSVQIGGSVDGLVSASGEGAYGIGMMSVRVTTPLGGRFALEGFVSVPRHEYEAYEGLYGVQIKQRIGRAGGDRPE